MAPDVEPILVIRNPAALPLLPQVAGRNRSAQ